MLARSGGDPLSEKRRVQGVPTFAEAARRVLEQKRGGWRGRWHVHNWWRSMARYVVPPRWQPARLRGQHGRRAGDPLADLARQGGDGQGSAPARPRGAGVEHRHGPSERQPLRSSAASARPAEQHRDAPAGAAPQGRRCGGRDGTDVEVRAACRQAGVRVSRADRRSVGGGQARDVGRDGRGRARVDRAGSTDEGEARAPRSAVRPGAGSPRCGAGARRQQSAGVPDAKRQADLAVDAAEDAPAPRDRRRCPRLSDRRSGTGRRK